MKVTQDEKLLLLMEMKKKKITMTKLSEHLNITCSAVSQWFNDRCTISSENVDKLVEYIEASV